MTGTSLEMAHVPSRLGKLLNSRPNQLQYVLDITFWFVEELVASVAKAIMGPKLADLKGVADWAFEDIPCLRVWLAGWQDTYDSL